MSDFSGRWIGSIRGTNVATFTLALDQAEENLRGELALNDVALGPAMFQVEGTAGDAVATFRFTPGAVAPGAAITQGSARAALQPDGSLAGIWEMEGQTFGGFTATRELASEGFKGQSPPRLRSASGVNAPRQLPPGSAPYRWMPIMGEFETSTDSLLFKGRRIPSAAGPPQPAGPLFLAAVGIVLCDRKMVNGTLTAQVTFDEVSPNSVCELIVAHDLRTKGQITAGLGGSGAMFSIREWVPAQTPQQTGGSWVNYELSGDRVNLQAGTTYLLAVRLQGSSVVLEVDGVEVAATGLPAAPNQPRQIGVFAVSENQVHISGFGADTERPTAFIVMQFSSPYNEVYSDVIKQMCDECRIDALRADEIYGPGIIVKDVIDRISKSQVVIADISPTNPNVYFEVGYALALGKPIILLAQRRGPDAPLPFDLSAFRVLFYDDSIGGKLKLEAGLRQHLRQILGND